MSKTKKINYKTVVKKVKRQTTKPVKGLAGLVNFILHVPAKVWGFLKGVKNELKLVEWLSRKQTVRWSSAVILTALIAGGLIVLLDLLYYNLRNLLFSING